MSAQPPQFPPQLRTQLESALKKTDRKKSARKASLLSLGRNTALTKRASVIFLSAFALVQCAPVLDRVFSQDSEDGLFAAQPSAGVAYEFAIEPTGIIRAHCDQGASRIELTPEMNTVRTSDGLFREVTVQAHLCTEFGYRNRKSSFYVPAELFRADSEVIQGAWETKTYTGVPSSSGSEETATLEVHRLPDGRLEIAPLPNAFEQPEFQPVQVSFNSPDEMATVQNWRSGLLPLKEIRFEYEHPFLAKPLVLQGKLTKIRSTSRSLSAALTTR